MWKPILWKPKPSRRDLLRAMGVATGASLLGCPPSSTDPDPDPDDPNGDVPPPDPGPAVVVRHDVTSAAAADDLAAYAEAVGAMKGRAISDLTSWVAQARIHLDHCPHSNAFFLPWHRAYLHYFEEICRQASGKADFALPYWNWTTHPAIPDALWEGPLDDPTRTIAPGQPIPPNFVGPGVIDGILQIADFETFGSRYVTAACESDPFQRSSCGSGELEAVPHNNVHNIVGGNMRTFMSPLDPIFWLHHCNVDRLWTEWNVDHANGNNPDWRSFVFQQNFVDAQGQPQDISVEGTFSTAALGYRYDTQPAAALAAPVALSANVVATAEVANTRRAQPQRALAIPVELNEEVRARLRPAAAAAIASTPSTVRLVLGGVPTPTQPLCVNLYVGASEAPTSRESPHYVRSFGFFPLAGEEGGHHHETNFLFSIGDDLERLGDGWDGEGPLPIHVESVPLTAQQGIAAVTEAVAPTSVRIEIVEHS